MGAREADSLPYGNAKQTAKPKAERLFPFRIPVLMLLVADDHVRDQYGEHGDREADQGPYDWNFNSTCGGNKHEHDHCNKIPRTSIYNHRSFKNNSEYAHQNDLQAFCFNIIYNCLLYTEFVT